MKRLMLIGTTTAGKTTITQYINNSTLVYKKTQAIEVIDNMIDTPGEYIENKAYYKALIVTAVDADIICLVQDCTSSATLFPPGFATIFNGKPVLGLATKSDISSESQIANAQKFLEDAGAHEIFVVSSYEGTGFEGFLDFINN